MEDKSFDIQLDHEGKRYNGWITVSEKKNHDQLPVSYHVVLDKVLFGNLSFNQGKWSVDDQRPESLTQAIGSYIEKKLIPSLKGSEEK